MQHNKSVWSVFMTFLLMTILTPAAAKADITCYDFTGPDEAQQIRDALPNDPFGLDIGWPWSSPGRGDTVAGNGVACDSNTNLPENASPGDEPYEVHEDQTSNGRSSLPDDVEQVTIASADFSTEIRSVENGDLVYAVNGVSTPEFEPNAN